jgi:hypothetical protein
MPLDQGYLALDVTCSDRSWVTGGSVISGMKKTSIYIEPEIDVALSRRAAEPVLAAWSAGKNHDR